MKEYLREILESSAPQGAVNSIREYLQARILESLQEHGAWASLAFMGDTSLRFLYRLPRFPEDLDFALEDPSGGFDFLGLIESARARFEREGYRTEAKAATRTAVNKAFIRFPGLEHEMGLRPHAERVEARSCSSAQPGAVRRRTGGRRAVSRTDRRRLDARPRGRLGCDGAARVDAGILTSACYLLIE